MRQTGTLTLWKPDKGFGFITPVGVGTKLFVHASEFERAARPAVGDRVTYDVAVDSVRGPRARNVRYADGRATAPAAGAQARLRAATVVAAGFVVALAYATLADWLAPVVLLGLLIASALSFVVYALDKAAAREGRRRVPEATLHLLDAVGGWPGGALAQQMLRHKSSKPAFARGFWMTVVFNVGVLGLTATPEARALFALVS